MLPHSIVTYFRQSKLKLRQFYVEILAQECFLHRFLILISWVTDYDRLMSLYALNQNKNVTQTDTHNEVSNQKPLTEEIEYENKNKSKWQEAKLEEKIQKRTNSSLQLLRPTIWLRIIPLRSESPGILVRALIDTGSSSSHISVELSNRILTLLPDSIRLLQQPTSVCQFPGEPERFVYKAIAGIRLRSCLQNFYTTDEVCLMVCSDTSSGGPRLREYWHEIVDRKLEKAELWHEKGFSGDYEQSWRDEIHLVIGRDLLTRHFLYSPMTPTYEIESGLVALRTKFGVTVLGTLDECTSNQWACLTDPEEAERMRQLLFRDEAKYLEAAECEKVDKKISEIKRRLIMNIPKSFWYTLLDSIPSVIKVTHESVVLLLVAMIFGCVQQFVKHCNWNWTIKTQFILDSAFVALIRLACLCTSRYRLHLKPLWDILQQMIRSGNCTLNYSVDQMSFSRSCILALMAENPTNGAQEGVRVLLDTGSPESWICEPLANQLGLKRNECHEHSNYPGEVCLKLSSHDGEHTGHIKMRVLRNIADILSGHISPPVNNELSSTLYECAGFELHDFIAHPTEILIGADAIAQWLIPESGVACFKLSPDISVLTTRLGPLIQGTQMSGRDAYVEKGEFFDCFNFFDNYSVRATNWKCLLVSYCTAAALLAVDYWGLYYIIF